MKADEVIEVFTKEVTETVEKKATKILNFTVVISEGGIRSMKVANERQVK